MGKNKIAVFIRHKLTFVSPLNFLSSLPVGGILFINNKKKQACFIFKGDECNYNGCLDEIFGLFVSLGLLIWKKNYIYFHTVFLWLGWGGGREV